MTNVVERNGASFRDRTTTVFHDGARILRALSTRGLANWRGFSSHPMAARLMDEGLVIRTREVELRLPAVDTAGVLEHERVAFVTYPYEWPFALLRRAALLHLELLERLIPEGFILSDATPSNVMFRGIEPVFIDVGSIVSYRAGDVWQGFRQFLETMLYPLMLSAYKGVPHQAWLRGAGENGIPVRQVSRIFGWRDVFRPGVLSHVKLAAALDRAVSPTRDVPRSEIRASGVPTGVLLKNVARLERITRRLEHRARRGVWLAYNGGSAYGDGGVDRKRALVTAVIEKIVPGPSMVWDLGCNTGDYSLLLARYASLVVAIDEDESVVDQLCQRCRVENVGNVLPLVVDLCNPSSAQGWQEAERLSLSARGKPDLIVALAIIHHLVLTKNLPVDEVLVQLARWGRLCLVEYVAPDDAHARSLNRDAGAGRNALPDRATFEALAARSFQILSVADITATRSLFLLESRISRT